MTRHTLSFRGWTESKFSFSNKPAPLFKLPFGKQKPKVFSGAFTYRPQQDTVVSAHQAGYQRKDVDEQFFNEFPPDLITTDFSRVQRIHELTLPYAKDAYRQAFVDNWSPSRSFLIVSW
ncbi:hypothetical protein V3H18_00075 [Methylocystis sp. 9N]|uniref:DUF72 domain-containing protein n=1 Tax=Methylocystis borbori TaxID=3118750 RepID=A0ABU7XC01_9HYPH